MRSWEVAIGLLGLLALSSCDAHRSEKPSPHPHHRAQASPPTASDVQQAKADALLKEATSSAATQTLSEAIDRSEQPNPRSSSGSRGQKRFTEINVQFVAATTLCDRTWNKSVSAFSVRGAKAAEGACRRAAESLREMGFPLAGDPAAGRIMSDRTLQCADAYRQRARAMGRLAGRLEDGLRRGDADQILSELTDAEQERDLCLSAYATAALGLGFDPRAGL